MQIPFLHQQIILETERLRDLHRSMMMHNSAIPASEMENFLQQLRKLYEISLQLGNENSLQLLNEVFLASQQHTKYSQPQHQEEQKNIQQAIVTKQPESPVIASAVTNIHAESIPVQPVSNNSFGQTVGKKFTEQSTVGGKIAGADNQKRFSDNIKLPVSDINSAIGINEKFQFINQLFHGDSQKYTQFISELNNCPSADVARRSIQQIAESNHWETIPVAKHFIDVIERRFA